VDELERLIHIILECSPNLTFPESRGRTRKPLGYPIASTCWRFHAHAHLADHGPGASRSVRPGSGPGPAPTPAPAAAPAQLTFTQTLKANKPAIEQLLKEFHPEDALAKAEALLPTAAPEFNGIDLRTASASSFQFSDLSRIYHLAAKCAMTDGLWEKGQVYLGKAKETAQSNYDHTAAAYKSSIETWTTAMATANKALTDGAGRIKELEAKQKPLTPRKRPS